MAADFQIAESSPSRLMVIASGHSLFSPWLALMIIVFFTLIWLSADRTARRVLASQKAPAELASFLIRFRLLGVGILVGSLGLFWLVSYTSGSIVLDKSANTASMCSKMTAFLPEQMQTTSLNNIERAILDYKPNSRRIRLLAHHGRDLAYPIWTDRSGQQQAIDAMNTFLGATQNQEQ